MNVRNRAMNIPNRAMNIRNSWLNYNSLVNWCGLIKFKQVIEFKLEQNSSLKQVIANINVNFTFQKFQKRQTENLHAHEATKNPGSTGLRRISFLHRLPFPQKHLKQFFSKQLIPFIRNQDELYRGSFSLVKLPASLSKTRQNYTRNFNFGTNVHTYM